MRLGRDNSGLIGKHPVKHSLEGIHLLVCEVAYAVVGHASFLKGGTALDYAGSKNHVLTVWRHALR